MHWLPAFYVRCEVYLVNADKAISKNYIFPGIESQLDALTNMPAIGDNVYNILEILPEIKKWRNWLFSGGPRT